MIFLIIFKVTEQDFTESLSKAEIETQDLPRLLIDKLAKSAKRVATAESCTGGLISKLITDCDGASSVFDCGVCSYANFVKENVLGVNPDTIRAFGAVSAECAKEMAEGVRKLSNADIGISTTGIAGPSGGTEEKPVGLIYIGIATEAKTDIIKAEFMSKNNNRDKNRQLAAALALYCAFHSL